jgi:hypothetical protein
VDYDGDANNTKMENFFLPRIILTYLPWLEVPLMPVHGRIPDPS